MIHILTFEDAADKLKVTRLAKGFTQKQFAAKLNVTQQTVSALENGVMDPSFRMLKRIAELLHENIMIGGAASE